MSFHRCTACDADLFDDPHFDDDTQEPLCDGCCLCMFSDLPLLDGSDAGTVACGGPTTAVPATSTAGQVVDPAPASGPAVAPSTNEEATAPAAHGPVA